MTVRELTTDDERDLCVFFSRIPYDDRGFFKEDLDDPVTTRRWLQDERGIRLVAIAGDGSFAGLAAAWRGLGRSGHVGDVRLVVAPTHRRRGVGRALARGILVASLEQGFGKLVVEVVAEQQGTIDMFLAIGFEPEAILRDQLRDAEGTLHDVVMLVHLAEDAAAAATLAQPETAAR